MFLKQFQFWNQIYRLYLGLHLWTAPMLWTFVVCASQDCGNVITGSPARTEIHGGCASFQNCHFQNIDYSDSHGGAIDFRDRTSQFIMTDSTFNNIRLYFSGRDDWGGCAFIEATPIAITRTCCYHCRAEDGQAYWLDECPNSKPSLELVSFVECSTDGDDDADTGAVACENDPVGLNLSTGNFTNCYVARFDGGEERWGSAVCLRGHTASDDRIAYSTFVGCGGYSTIDVFGEQSITRLTIENCVFSQNPNANAIIYLRKGKVTLANCIFVQTTAVQFLGTRDNDCLFKVTDCSFDLANLPAASYADNSDNVFNFTGITPYIAYPDTAYCSAAAAPPQTLRAQTVAATDERSQTRRIQTATATPAWDLYLVSRTASPVMTEEGSALAGSKMGGGAVAGVTIGALAGVAVIAVIVWFVLRGREEGTLAKLVDNPSEARYEMEFDPDTDSGFAVTPASVLETAATISEDLFADDVDVESGD
jgi:hypothetical protein